MGDILRNAVETKRRKLINKLIAYEVYPKEDKHLFELSLTDLEYEYRRFMSQCHPHGGLGSLKLNSKKSKS